jgi:hypothetical protein
LSRRTPGTRTSTFLTCVRRFFLAQYLRQYSSYSFGGVE